MSSRNPFNRNRAEQMGEATWKYFVREPFTDLLSEKPLIFEGSRGCGKTMFFVCNSWKERVAEMEAEGLRVPDLFSKDSFLGFYYKVDGKFVGKNLAGKGVEDWVWQSVFNTYFNVIICKEILEFIQFVQASDFVKSTQLLPLLSRVSEKIRVDSKEVGSEKALGAQLDKILDSIELFSNDPEGTQPIGLHAGTLISTILEELRKVEIFKESRFHIFIDEFEELSEDQQKQLNTLVKQSRYWIVYDIGVKTNGRYTEETISGEIIRDPDDYKQYYPEMDSYERKEEYEGLLFSICKKRLVDVLPDGLSDDPRYSDIRFYLKDYGKDVELKEFEDAPKFPGIKSRLKKIIDERILEHCEFDPKEIPLVYSTLLDTTPDVIRMHICLLGRKGKAALTVKELYEAAINNTSEYREWRNNILFATFFLLCKELDVVKKYHGLTTFSMLSSGVIRSFLEICESAFDYAFSREFTFSNPRPLTLDEQTNAAHYVSQSKVSKIEGFVPNGMLLKRFMLALGRIFYLKTTDPNATLGEPEPNHFYTKTFELRTAHPDANRILENAIMHNVLQFELPTKEKNDNVETTDFHINHIYCPYFKISHRRKRKIYLAPDDLKALLIGTSQEIEKVVKNSATAAKTTIQGKLNFSDDDLSGEV